jgi:hypothetical protein
MPFCAYARIASINLIVIDAITKEVSMIKMLRSLGMAVSGTVAIAVLFAAVMLTDTVEVLGGFYEEVCTNLQQNEAPLIMPYEISAVRSTSSYTSLIDASREVGAIVGANGYSNIGAAVSADYANLDNATEVECLPAEVTIDLEDYDAFASLERRSDLENNTAYLTRKPYDYEAVRLLWYYAAVDPYQLGRYGYGTWRLSDREMMMRKLYRTSRDYGDNRAFTYAVSPAPT